MATLVVEVAKCKNKICQAHAWTRMVCGMGVFAFGTRHLVFYEVYFKDLSGAHDIIECVSYIFEDPLSSSLSVWYRSSYLRPEEVYPKIKCLVHENRTPPFIWNRKMVFLVWSSWRQASPMIKVVLTPWLVLKPKSLASLVTMDMDRVWLALHPSAIQWRQIADLCSLRLEMNSLTVV